MAINRFLVKDNGNILEEIDLRNRKYSGLNAGEHVIAVEAYMDEELVAATSRNITISESNLDPDYEKVIFYANANGIPLPTVEQQEIDSNMLTEYKLSGGWDRDDYFFKFKGTADPQFKLICWKRLIQAVPYGDLVWSNNGVEGNGFNAYIDPKFTSQYFVNYTLDNASFQLVYYKDPSTNFEMQYGATGSSYIYMVSNRGSANSAAINSSIAGGLAPYHSLGLVSINRTSNSNLKIISNNTNLDISSFSTYLPNASPYLFARNDNPGVSTYSTGGVSYLMSGANKADLDAAIRPILEA